MSRQHKYRAWDKKLKKYHYFEGIFNEQPWTEKSTFAQYESCPELHEVEIEEWAGHLAKNGKEIYEGDIIQSGQKELGENVYQYEVVFASGSFVGSDNRIKHENPWRWVEWPFEYFEDCEIIGNIHLNPELIEAKS